MSRQLSLEVRHTTCEETLEFTAFSLFRSSGLSLVVVDHAHVEERSDFDFA